MAKKSGVRPFHAGGRTLANLSRKVGGSEASHKKKKTWFEAFGITYGEKGISRSYLQGQTPLWIVEGMARTRK